MDAFSMLILSFLTLRPFLWALCNKLKKKLWSYWDYKITDFKTWLRGHFLLRKGFLAFSRRITFFIQVSLNVAWPCFDSSIAHLIICATLFWFKYRSLRIVCTYFHSIIAQLENQVLPSLICCAARAIELNRVHTSSTYPHIQFLGNFWGKIPTRTVSRILLEIWGYIICDFT